MCLSCAYRINNVEMEWFGKARQEGFNEKRVIHHSPHISIELMAYWAQWAGGVVNMNDHNEYRWVTVGQLAEFDFAPADVPFVYMLRDR